MFFGVQALQVFPVSRHARSDIQRQSAAYNRSLRGAGRVAGAAVIRTERFTEMKAKLIFCNSGAL